MLIRDALAAELAKRKVVDGADKLLLNPERPRIRFSGQRPVRCN